VSTEFLNEFASEQDGPVRVSDVLARGVPIRWDEAVALLQEILETITAGGGEDAPIPAFEDVLIDDQGAVRINAARRGERGPVAAGRALHTMLATADVPLPLRLFVTQANAPETHKSLKAFADALAYFGRPGRSDMIRAIFERYRSIAPLAQTVSAPGRPATPPPLPNHAARGDEFPEARRKTPQWLMPAAVAICVMSVAAVIWFGVIGGRNSSATASAATAEAPAADATPTAVTAKNATSSSKDAKRPAAKATVVEGGAAPATRTRPQPTPTSGRDIARESNAPLFDPSTARVTEAQRLPQVAQPPANETAKARATVIPSSSEYVIAPRENAMTTIYSPADADVQPPVMIYPSLPPTVFVARDQEATVINRMELVVAADGTVERVRLVNGPTRMPDMMLLSGAKLWKFTPAVKDGVPVRYRTTVTWAGFP
jgi:hypothetical protein